ncbi:FtsX-like permease family protein [Micromonospora sp. WMMD980]|uniref:FtsX-like permease family protein n=1 Tax=Micromonospora sp. WMMD980 TaxID=3016088 RepID=UPI002417A4A2|nr:FtsX-like permease family protein [Micromonospora sp. WMMD980]MDG4803197.1 FtsX-like permease family protein [Micromonospora sp. WMMD980]
MTVPARRSGLAPWLLAMRIARRSAIRNKGRALLIALLLAVPVYAGATLLLVWQASYASTQSEASWKLGQADLRLDVPSTDAVTSQLPAGSNVVAFSSGETVIEAPAGYRVTTFDAADVSDPMHQGRYVVRSGRPAGHAGEATLSSSLAESIGVRPGSTISLGGAPGRALAVVGVVDTADQLSRQMMVVSSADPLAQRGTQHLLVDLPGDQARWEPPAINGLSYADRASIEPTAAQQATRIAGLVVVVGFAGVQVGLLAATAFSVGARRQRREMAMLSAVGATPPQVTRVLLADGALLGLLGGATGVIAAVATFAAARDTLERLVNHPLKDTAPPVTALLLLVVGAIGFGLLAALGPAWNLARLQVWTALASRELKPRAQALRLTRAAGALAAVGLLIVLYAVRPQVSDAKFAAIGAGLILLGLAAAGPALVAVASRVVTRLSFPARMAVRHADRHRLRTGAAVAAICAAVAGSTAIVLFFSADTSTGAARQPNIRSGQLLIPAQGASALTEGDQTALRQRLPIRALVPITTAPATAGYFSQGGPSNEPPPDLSQAVAVGGEDLISAVTGRAATAEARDALNRGDAVAFYPAFAKDGRARLDINGKNVDLPALVVPIDNYYRQLPAIMISAASAQRLNLSTSSAGLIIDTMRPPTTEETQAAESVVLGAQVRAEGNSLSQPARLVSPTKVSTGQATDPLLYVLAIVSGVVTIVATTVVVGLARVEMRTDLSTMSAIGAGPRILRFVNAVQAAFIVGLGALAGTVAGIAPAAGLVALRPDMTWRMAWGPLVIIVVGAPILAMAVAATLRQPRLLLTRRLG